MTSRSRRKPRTTAPRTWGPGTACRLALFAALAGGTASGQQPGGAPPGVRPAAVYGTPFPTTVGQPGGVPGGYARAGTSFPQPTAQYQQAGAQPPRQPQPAPQPTGTTGRPDTGPPAGYRPVSGGPPPAPRADRVGAAGGAGQVMYFHKPADALAVDGMPDPGAVAQAAAPPVLAPVATDAPVGLPVIAPPPPPGVTERPIFAPTPVPLAVPAPVVQESAPQPAARPAPAAPQPAPEQPMAAPPKAADQAGPYLPAGVDLSVPSRDKIFGMMYDDVALQKAIIERAKEDVRRREKKEATGNWEFPTLAPVVPAGTPFVSRTGTQPPLRVVSEPGFVVHRRLHFEEKNSERYGWDLGFATPLVSAAYFYKDVLLWPNSLATGAVVGFWDTSAGKCLPGSPVPYYLYPPGLTITGTTAEALVITGAAFVVP